MNDWKPIETAPKDGTRVLVWSQRIGCVEICWWDGDDWESMNGLYAPHCGDEPTHWMLLPSLPQEVTSGA